MYGPFGQVRAVKEHFFNFAFEVFFVRFSWAKKYLLALKYPFFDQNRLTTQDFEFESNSKSTANPFPVMTTGISLCSNSTL